MSDPMQRAIDEVRAVAERDDLYRAIDRIAGEEGFTKAGLIYHDAADRLHRLGMPVHEIPDFLSRLYWAAASEENDRR